VSLVSFANTLVLESWNDCGVHVCGDSYHRWPARMTPEEVAIQDILFVALCRPSMKMGVPSVGLMINICVGLIVGGWVGIGGHLQLVYSAVMIVVGHLLIRAAVARDHNIFRILSVGVETKGRAGLGGRFGTSSVTPLPAVWPRKAAELSINA
jgi:type IV secretory pathway VirB3-like protein